MVIGNGYQFLEVTILDKWLVGFANRNIVIAVLSWLSKELTADIERSYPGVRVEVVRVEYIGAYPSLGIRYTDDRQPDLADYCEEKIQELLVEKSAFELISYVLDYEKSWNDEENIMFSKSN